MIVLSVLSLHVKSDWRLGACVVCVNSVRVVVLSLLLDGRVGMVQSGGGESVIGR